MSFILPATHFTYGENATEALFGGNVLAPRGQMTGEDSYAEAAEELGVTGMRFPGGSLTEYCFNWNTPDECCVTDERTGEEVDFITTTDFMAHAEAVGEAVTIVLPTRTQLSEETDAQGNRMPEVDEEGLREFIHDLASGAYGDVNIAAFEIGNEYWGSGEMNAVEYGRLSAEMSKIIDSELTLVAETYGVDTSGVSVLTQMGHNYNYSRISEDYEGWDARDVIDDLNSKYPDADIDYDNIRTSSGEPNWTEVNNALVRMSFDTDPEAAEAIDGVIAHVYSRGSEASRQYDLDMIKKAWLDEDQYQDLEIHVTEWNLKATQGLDHDANYGLHQAHEILNIMEDFMASGVDQAHVWPLVQNTANTLSQGHEFSDPTVPGEMFSIMSENIPGKTIIDFTPQSDRESEYDTGTADVHAFAGEGDMVFYIASTSQQNEMNDIDISNFVAGFDSMEVTRLGVAVGANPGSTRSEAHVEHLDPNEVFHDGILEADLTPGEIMQVVIRGVQPTNEFAPTLAAIDGLHDVLPDLPDDEEVGVNDTLVTEPDVTLDDDFPIPLLDPEPEFEDLPQDEEDGASEDDGGWDGIGWAIGILPVLAAIGAAGF